MTREPRTTADPLLTQIRSCLDAASSHPGLVKASVYQSEGYLRGLQGLSWEAPAVASPAPGDVAGHFLKDVRLGEVALRGRVKRESEDCLKAFWEGMTAAFPDCADKPFASAVTRTWVRWVNSLGALPSGMNADDFSRASGRQVGAVLKRDYEEGIAGHLAVFLLDKRLHLLNVPDYLRMRGWLLGTIEHMRQSGDPAAAEIADILDANLASIVLRALHNAGCSYAADALRALPVMMSELDAAIVRLSRTEPEASLFLRNNRSTILTRALHSGIFGYGAEVTENLPSALKNLNRQIARVESSSPKDAQALRSNRRSVVYRALTNGRLDYLQDKATAILPRK